MAHTKAHTYANRAIAENKHQHGVEGSEPDLVTKNGNIFRPLRPLPYDKTCVMKSGLLVNQQCNMRECLQPTAGMDEVYQDVQLVQDMVLAQLSAVLAEVTGMRIKTDVMPHIHVDRGHSRWSGRRGRNQRGPKNENTVPSPFDPGMANRTHMAHNL
jgi:hypothetical protein